MQSSDPKADHIRAIPFFAAASLKAIQAVASAADEIPVAAQRELIKEGEHNRFAYIVQSGEAEVLVGDEAVATIGSGEMIGELGFFNRGAATATVRAVTEMQVLALPYNRFESVLDENPAMLRSITEDLARRLRAMDARRP